MSDYSELKLLAEAATQGPWNHYQHGVIKGGPVVQFANGSAQQQIIMTTGAEWMRDGEQYDNADFIAAANPAAVLALIAEVEALRKDAERYRWLRQYTVKSLAVSGALASLDRDIDAAMTKGAKP